MTATTDAQPPIVSIEHARLFEQHDRALLPELPPYGLMTADQIEAAASAAAARGDATAARRIAFAKARLQLLREAGELTLDPPPEPSTPLSRRPVMSSDLPEEDAPLAGLMDDPAPQAIQLSGFSFVNYDNPTAGSTTFPLTTSTGQPIGYLSPQHIHVFSSTAGGSEVELTRPSAWDFDPTGTAVVLKTPTVAGQSIRIRRHTPLDKRFTTFQKGTLLTSDQLNASANFNLFIIQECYDLIGGASLSSS